MSQYGYYEGMSSSVLYVERFSSITRALEKKEGGKSEREKREKKNWWMKGRRKIKIIVRVYDIIIDLRAMDLQSGETNGEKLGRLRKLKC